MQTSYLLMSCRSFNKSQSQDVEQAIEILKKKINTQLSPESDKNDIFKFLDSEKISHTDISDRPEKYSDFTEKRLWEYPGKIKHVIFAIIEEPKPIGFLEASWEIHINFYLDPDRKMATYTISKFYIFL